jgi:NADH-quinone oxidoreductase subunit L
VLDLVWLIPALPLAGFAIILLFGRRLGDPKAGYLATLMCAAAFVVTVGVYFDLLSKPSEERSTLSLFLGARRLLKVDLALLVDPLSITMCLFVTGVGVDRLYAIGTCGDPVKVLPLPLTCSRSAC